MSIAEVLQSEAGSAMRDLLSWNVSLGRWAGVNVRLHVSFLVLIVTVLHMGADRTEPNSNVPALVGLAILFLSVVAHELGHCTAAWKLGGRIERSVLGPWGGLTYVAPSRDPRFELLTALAGPAVNLSLTLICTVALIAAGLSVERLLNPFTLPELSGRPGVAGLVALVAWINWAIVLVNSLPAYPLDGARALRAVVRPKFGFRSAVALTWRTGFTAAFLLFGAAWFLYDPYPMASLACCLLGIFLYFSSSQEADRLHEMDAGNDADPFEERLDAAEDDRPRPTLLGPLRRWLRRRSQERLARRVQRAREEAERADDVLLRLHTYGPQSLSADDRALLERVSARYRRRQSVDE